MQLQIPSATPIPASHEFMLFPQLATSHRSSSSCRLPQAQPLEQQLISMTKHGITRQPSHACDHCQAAEDT